MLCTMIGAIILSINIQAGLNMYPYYDIGDASSSLRGSTSSSCLIVCLSVPREMKWPKLQDQSYSSNWYINGKVFTSTTAWKPKKIFSKKNRHLVLSCITVNWDWYELIGRLFLSLSCIAIFCPCFSCWRLFACSGFKSTLKLTFIMQCNTSKFLKIISLVWLPCNINFICVCIHWYYKKRLYCFFPKAM